MKRCSCGMWYASNVTSEYRCSCGRLINSSKQKVEGLGDWTERQLKTIGVTKERYKEVKRLFGLSPKCNCEARKEWLNKVSQWFRNRSE